jgi:hypothetical protein
MRMILSDDFDGKLAHAESELARIGQGRALRLDGVFAEVHE